MSAEPAIPPGSTIGILGGGQLGRMTALAAARLGYRVHVFCQDDDEPAAQVSAAATLAAWDDEAALDAFAAAVDVATFEFENVSLAAAERLAASVPLRPGPNALAISQDRLIEKTFLAEAGVALPDHAKVDGPRALRSAMERIGCPVVLKTARLGYDGKGQVRIDRDTDLEAAWASLGAPVGVLEAFVPFTMEMSVIVARARDGTTAVYDPSENRHRNHVLAETIVPAPVSPAVRAEATRLAIRVAEALDLVGLVALEMFLLEDGRILGNEIAPRPHNSGHWTQDACRTDQFEQLVRAICGLPLGSTERLFDATMENLLGRDVERWRDVLLEPDARLHLYGKREAPPGRKMGHVNRIGPRTGD